MLTHRHTVFNAIRHTYTQAFHAIERHLKLIPAKSTFTCDYLWYFFVLTEHMRPSRCVSIRLLSCCCRMTRCLGCNNTKCEVLSEEMKRMAQLLPAFGNSIVYCGDASAYTAPHLKTSIIKRVDLDHDTVLYSSIAYKPGAFADAKITSRPSQRPDA